ncbi:hypothetical protein B9Z55_027874 [Caenorhabditis nigoni]|uniref:Uncharacterized protein n=1 Tax=Caenorhabditis nigoni TaxID=1611254 RepID=A0A2G5SEB9_9PELO|nr:hypothetical protein B9Z55_027874 [Caenorhabditis nigoni]
MQDNSNQQQGLQQAARLALPGTPNRTEDQKDAMLKLKDDHIFGLEGEIEYMEYHHEEALAQARMMTETTAFNAGRDFDRLINQLWEKKAELDNEELKVENRQFKGTREHLENQKQNYQSEREAANKEKENLLNAHAAKLEELVNKNQVAMNDQKKENEDLKKALEELKNDKMTLEAAIKSLEDEKKTVENNLKNQEAEKSKLRMERDAATTENARLNANWMTAKNQMLKEHVENLRMLHQNHEAEKEELAGKVRQLQKERNNDNKNFETEKNEWQRQKEALEVDEKKQAECYVFPILDQNYDNKFIYSSQSFTYFFRIR